MSAPRVGRSPLCLSLLASSCARDAPPAPVTGWVVGWTNDASQLPTARILNTADGGVTWRQQALPADALDVERWKVSFVGARR